MLALLLLLQLSQAPPPVAVDTDPRTASAPARAGTDGHGAPTVTIPRVDETIVLDGSLEEPAWAQAARLVGFSQYQPVDGRPAEEQTEVLVWYSPSALHFGIVARDREPGAIRATVADRDNLSRDDTVTVYLDTFNDKRRAFFFTVNPLGMQEDGVRTEGSYNAGTMYGGMTDKNPDYQWDSRGRLTEEGFVVEIRIPFKSLRYPGNGPQRWGINVERKVQRTGYLDTWTDVRRANSSYLAQAGGIDGLHDLKRGVVTEVQPFVTASNDGAVRADGTFGRDAADFNPGVNVRLGLTNVSVDATVNPDFSQVESDAGQVTANQRFALFYSEKRPFFLEGIELFSTPNQLVYTRQIVSPLAGGKVTGKFGRLNVAFLSAKEKESAGSALFNVARLRRDIGSNSTMGVTYTDRAAEGEYNRVLAADSRIVFGKLYYVQGQIGQSWTGDPITTGAATTTPAAQVTTSSPVWLGEFDRTGRAWGFNYRLTGFGSDVRNSIGLRPPQQHRRLPCIQPPVVVWQAGRGHRAVHHVLRPRTDLAVRRLRPLRCHGGQPERELHAEPAWRLEHPDAGRAGFRPLRSRLLRRLLRGRARRARAIPGTERAVEPLGEKRDSHDADLQDVQRVVDAQGSGERHLPGSIRGGRAGRDRHRGAAAHDVDPRRT